MIRQFALDLRAHILADATISGFISERLFPMVTPSDVPLPAMTYRVDDGSRDVFYRGSLGLATTDVQLDFYSESFDSNTTATDAIHDLFNGFSGEMGDTIISRAQVDSTLQIVEDKNDVFRTTFNIQFLT